MTGMSRQCPANKYIFLKQNLSYRREGHLAGLLFYFLFRLFLAVLALNSELSAC
jgi:hypothetical protein